MPMGILPHTGHRRGVDAVYGAGGVGGGAGLSDRAFAGPGTGHGSWTRLSTRRSHYIVERQGGRPWLPSAGATIPQCWRLRLWWFRWHWRGWRCWEARPRAGDDCRVNLKHIQLARPRTLCGSIIGKSLRRPDTEAWQPLLRTARCNPMTIKRLGHCASPFGSLLPRLHIAYHRFRNEGRAFHGSIRNFWAPAR